MVYFHINAYTCHIPGIADDSVNIIMTGLCAVHEVKFNWTRN